VNGNSMWDPERLDTRRDRDARNHTLNGRTLCGKGVAKTFSLNKGFVELYVLETSVLEGVIKAVRSDLPFFLGQCAERRSLR
jgi:hypothetical protein